MSNNGRDIVNYLYQSFNFLIGTGDGQACVGWISRELAHEVVVS
jgi:hypothetical protein